MTRHRFYIGCTDKDGNAVPLEAFDRIERELLAEFDGFTRYETVGGWRDAGKTIHEPSRVYEIVTPHEETFIAPWIKLTANQTAVLYTRESVHGEFV